MAVVTKIETPGGGYVYKWSLTTADPNGDAVFLGGAPDKSVQFVATAAGTATAVLQCSNQITSKQGAVDLINRMTDVDPTSWELATDPQGNDISKTGSDLEAVLENAAYWRPILSVVGTAAVWDVYLFSRRGY